MFVRILWLFLALAAFQLPAANAQEPQEEVVAEVDQIVEQVVGESSADDSHAIEVTTEDGEVHSAEVHADESHASGEHDGATHAGASHDGESHGDDGSHAAHGGEHDSHGDHADDAHGGDAHAGGNTNPLSVDPDLMIFTGIIFCLLLAVLGKFAWGPIRDSLDEREKGIEAQIAEAHRSNEEARRLLAEHEEKVAKASDEVREMLDKAKADAESQKASILAEAEAAAKSQKDRAVKEIHAAKNTALEQLAESSVDQALGLAGSIVGKKLDKKDHTNLIQEALKHIPSDN